MLDDEGHPAQSIAPVKVLLAINLNNGKPILRHSVVHLSLLTRRLGLHSRALAIVRRLSPLARRAFTFAMSSVSVGRPSTLPVLRARRKPAFVRSEMLSRSCSARVAMILITTSRMMPHESKNGSMKLRQRTPQLSSRSRYASVLRTNVRADTLHAGFLEFMRQQQPDSGYLRLFYRVVTDVWNQKQSDAAELSRKLESANSRIASASCVRRWFTTKPSAARSMTRCGFR